MASAKKLPSGSWRVRVFSHKDTDGKPHYESFTAPTKKEAEAAAAIWNANRTKRRTDLTVSEAVSGYIESKRNVLSPSTIRGYAAMSARFEPIGNRRLDALTTDILQRWISGMSADLSAKSVKNTWGLLSATLEHYEISKHFNVTLPSANPHEYKLPSDDDVLALLRHTEGQPLWIAIMLARYYSLRRSEICALERSDIDGNVLTISKAVVHDDENGWILKPKPKTHESYRHLALADPLLSTMCAQDGKYFDCNPDALDNRLRRAQKATGVMQFGFHALRHMFATKAAINGIPDIFTSKMGGWATDSRIMKRIYQNVQTEDLAAQMDILNRTMQQDMTRNMTQKSKKPLN